MAFVLALLPVTARAQISHQSNFNNVSVQYQDTVVGSVTYRAYTVAGMEVTTIPECPQVPKQVLTFSVPYNAKNLTVQVTGGQSQTSGTLPFKIIPVLQERAICDSLPNVLTADSTVYHTNAFYPANAAEMVGEGYYMGENHIVTVAAYPIQYNPVTNKIKLNKLVNFTITYNLAEDSLCNVFVRDDASLRQQGWNEVKNIVMNPNQVENFAPIETVCQFLGMQYFPDSLMTHLNDSVGYGGELYTNTCEYMIITNHELAPSFKRLAALKRQKGYTVGVRCIEDIITDPMVQFGDKLLKPDGTYSCINDSAGKLRHYLRLAYLMDQTRFVLFGGRNVPFRYGYLPDTVSSPQEIMDLNKPTDLYFSDLNTNWDADGDGYFGEPQDFGYENSFDCSPELFVGRLMAESTTHINNYTDKLFRYELNPGKGNSNYLSRVLVTDGMKIIPNQWKFDGVTQYLANAYSSVFSNVTLIPITSNPKGIEIINQINNIKYGIVNMFGHGCPYNIKVNENDLSLVLNFDYRKSRPNDAGLDLLNNKYFPFIIYSESCTNMPFDIYQNYSHSWVFNLHNLAQSFTLGKDYGGVAFLGNTRNGYSGVTKYSGESYSHPRMEKMFVQQLSLGHSKIGVAEAMSKWSFSQILYNPHRYLMQHNLMGEPEFDIWTDAPSNFNGVNISRGDNSIIVSGITSDSTIVAVCGNSTTPMRKRASNGMAIFNNVSPNSSVMVYQHNYLPYIAPLYVQNATLSRSQYVIASDAYLGRNVDSNRTTGDVVIPTNVSYEMEYTGNVLLAPGFTVEKGATLSIVPSDY